MKSSLERPKPVLVGLIATELVSAAFAWRDLARRKHEQVRGTKIGWRLFIALNPGNSLAYRAIGRIRISPKTD